MTQWLRALLEAICAEEPTARDAAIITGFVLLVPFGWLALFVRPIRRAFRTR